MLLLFDRVDSKLKFCATGIKETWAAIQNLNTFRVKTLAILAAWHQTEPFDKILADKFQNKKGKEVTLAASPAGPK